MKPPYLKYIGIVLLGLSGSLLTFNLVKNALSGVSVVINKDSTLIPTIEIPMEPEKEEKEFNPEKDKLFYSFTLNGTKLISVRKGDDAEVVLEHHDYRLTYQRIKGVEWKRPDKITIDIITKSGGNVLADTHYDSPQHRVSQRAKNDLIAFIETKYLSN